MEWPRATNSNKSKEMAALEEHVIHLEHHVRAMEATGVALM